jgi:hypothetical protein
MLTSGKTNTSALDLLSVEEGMLTSVESARSDHVFRFVSTSEVLWVDERCLRKPLLGYRHGRNFDRSLGIQTVDLMS